MAANKIWFVWGWVAIKIVLKHVDLVACCGWLHLKKIYFCWCYATLWLKLTYQGGFLLNFYFIRLLRFLQAHRLKIINTLILLYGLLDFNPFQFAIHGFFFIFLSLCGKKWKYRRLKGFLATLKEDIVLRQQ